MAISNYKVLGQITSGLYERLPVKARGLTTNQAYFETTTPHGLTVGDRVEVWSTDQSIMNRRRVVSKLGKNDDTNPTVFFTVPLTNANIADAAQTTAYVYSYENAQGKTKTFELESGGTYEAVNKKFSFDEQDYKYKVLTNGKVGFTIYVKEKLSEQDVFLCDVSKKYTDINGKIKEARQKDVNIKFLYSDGYKPTQTKQQ
jgi:hypothetical protein